MRLPDEPDWSPEEPPALDGDSAERLASGRIAPEDAPPGYEAVASLLHSVASTAWPEPKGEAATVAAMAAALAPDPLGTTTSLSSRRRQSMITKLVSAKAAAVAVGALLSTGTAAAAGALGPLQPAAADILGAVGIQVPDGSGGGSITAQVDDTTTTVVDSTTTTIDDGTTTTTIDDGTTTTTIGDGTTTTTIDDGDDACASAVNHGQFVSGVARATPSGPGKGAVVSDAAHSDCGKGGDDGEDDDTTDTTVASNRGSNSGPGSANSGPGNSGNGGGNGGGNGRGNGGGNGRGNSGKG